MHVTTHCRMGTVRHTVSSAFLVIRFRVLGSTGRKDAAHGRDDRGGPHTTPTPWTGVRFQPSVALGLLVYAGYLAIFYATWAINDVDYDTIGDTVESTKLHYAMPTLLGCAFLVVIISVLGWWKVTLFDSFRSGPKWAWIGPIAMFLLAVVSFAGVTWGNASSSLLLWSVLGAIGVGFGEEMITRGALLVGLRTNHHEVMAWLFSTLAFAALHIPNVLFGQSVANTAVQLVFTFLVGSLLWSIRRLSGHPDPVHVPARLLGLGGVPARRHR